MKKTYLFLVIFLLIYNFCFSQSDSIDIYDLSLEELLQLEVKVLTKTGVTIRENPAVITVITSEDIKKSGARDLQEVFNIFVPAFQFGTDVEGAVGLGVRGLWAFEGKLLLMINGMECNEEMFATLLFGNHYQVENIDKIEIVRGPGSAIYGGFAGLGVINIITKNENLNGGYFSGLYSQMTKSYSHRNVNLAFGKKFNQLSISANASYSEGIRSQLDNIDYYENKVNLTENSNLNSTFINLSAQYKGLYIKSLIDNYNITQIDLWGENMSKALPEKWNTSISEIGYDIKIKDKFIITPRFQYKYQLPWNLELRIPEENPSVDSSYKNSKTIQKMIAGISSLWNINKKMSLVSGVEYFENKLIMPKNPVDYEESFKNNKNFISVNNFSIYSQYLFFNKIVNLTLGGRYDYSTQYGNSFVPRIGFTKVLNKLHFKAMISQSFRIPGGIISNRISDNVKKIEPEKATNYEVELGYKIGNFYFVTNAYKITFNKVIIYGSDAQTGIGTYVNSGKLGTYGIEMELKYITGKFTFISNYAHYIADEKDVTAYIVPSNNNYFLAFTNHRFNFLTSLKITNNISINLNMSYHGKKYGYSHYDSENELDILKSYAPSIISGFNIQFNNLLKNKIDIMLGVNNILDDKMLYAQPYNGGHAPLPGLSRALTFKMNFHF